MHVNEVDESLEKMNPEVFQDIRINVLYELQATQIL